MAERPGRPLAGPPERCAVCELYAGQLGISFHKLAAVRAAERGHLPCRRRHRRKRVAFAYYGREHQHDPEHYFGQYVDVVTNGRKHGNDDSSDCSGDEYRDIHGADRDDDTTCPRVDKHPDDEHGANYGYEYGDLEPSADASSGRDDDRTDDDGPDTTGTYGDFDA